LALCTVSLGQLKVSEERIQTWVGFESPRVVNGLVLAGASSKPSLAETKVLIRVEKAVDYKFMEIECERIPSLEFVELKEVEGGYTFPQETPAGTYRIAVRCFDPGIVSKRITVVLGPTPAPPEPTPPTPTPPTPEPTPTPTPPAPPAPIPGDGLRVLIVYEQDDQAKYAPSQVAQMYSIVLRKYLNEVCVKAPNGQPEYRVLDEEVEAGPDSAKIWIDAIKRPRASMPWLIVSNGKTGYEGPLPLEQADTIKIIEKLK
jgi:hypothetical protein